MTAPFQLFDTLDPAIEAALRASIARWGVIVPVVLDQHGRMIDGHHRKRIATELGVPCPEQTIDVENAGEARQVALSLNADRRQLDPSHRQEMVAHLRGEGFSQREIARALGTSQSTVRDDLKQVSTPTHLPDGVRGRDGKRYPATRPTAVPEPARDDDLWTCQDCGGYSTDDEEDPQRCRCNYADLAGSRLDPDEPELAEDEIANPFGDADLPDEDDEPVPPRSEWKPAKPDLGNGVSHPARYSPELIPLFAELLAAYSHPGARILDPFAGTGRIHDLHPEFDTVGIEIEPEWANLHPRTQIGSALDLPFDPETFDAIVTSPTYGNRLADSHDASDPERRRSYTHDLGRDLADENSGDMHWRTTSPGAGAMGSFDYRNFHGLAWIETVRVLRSGGLFVLNLCDHIRDGLIQPVTAWHTWCLGRLGLEYVESRSVPTRKLRQGANGNLREQEQVHVFRKLT